jgi:hypothetical protein
MAQQRSHAFSRRSSCKVGTSIVSAMRQCTKYETDRLERLEWTITALTHRVNVLEADRSNSDRRHSEAAYQTPTDEERHIARAQDGIQPIDQDTAPLFILRDATTDSDVELQDINRTATNSPSQAASDDIIVKRLISPQDAYTLLSLFQTHYARWVCFDQDLPTAVLLDKVRKSPLLLTACCLIAVR